eukprot:TRINITY_DN6954_c0_g1_i1.p1 TRINITY_DN6954_c0_g1~~TRINITY_DN6954_c0_g1_i1.p1  ORF type:complete len:536 (+),score=132.92 TRINITY_DN6954_c0_g1_i1:28-1608(+)
MSERQRRKRRWEDDGAASADLAASVATESEASRVGREIAALKQTLAAMTGSSSSSSGPPPPKRLAAGDSQPTPVIPPHLARLSNVHELVQLRNDQRSQKPQLAPVSGLSASSILNEADRLLEAANLSIDGGKKEPVVQQKNPYLLDESEPSMADSQASSSFVDPRLIDVGKKKKPATFKFVEEGTWVKKADALRNYQIAVTMSAGESALLWKIPDSIPKAEWWDVPLLKNSDGIEVDGDPRDFQLNEGIIDAIIHFPPIPRDRSDDARVPELPEMLTEKEKKRLKRQRSQEKQKQKQEAVALGLAPPPEDRLTLKSFMRILSNEAIEDPTAVEAQVRAQMEKRRIAAETHNEARRLTVTEKKEKHRKKLQEKANEIFLEAFMIEDLSNPSHLFKVRVNAEQLNLTGVLITYKKGCNLVVVEGGPRNLRKYTRLLLERMKWEAETSDMVMDDDDGEDAAQQYNGGASDKHANHCIRLFSGLISKPNYQHFKVWNCEDNEYQARKVLNDKGLGHLWELAKSGKKLEEN